MNENVISKIITAYIPFHICFKLGHCRQDQRRDPNVDSKAAFEAVAN
jgi:hypothetical protein